MLNQANIRTKLQTPEWATLWANVQAGKVPFYYMGRGSVVDPSVAFAEQFETGGSPRIGYSNPKLDELLLLERQTFDPGKRKKVLSEAMTMITEEAPAHFLWRHQFLYCVFRTKPATDSGANRPPNPAESGHRFAPFRPPPFGCRRQPELTHLY